MHGKLFQAVQATITFTFLHNCWPSVFLKDVASDNIGYLLGAKQRLLSPATTASLPATVAVMFTNVLYAVLPRGTIGDRSITVFDEPWNDQRKA